MKFVMSAPSAYFIKNDSGAAQLFQWDDSHIAAMDISHTFEINLVL